MATSSEVILFDCIQSPLSFCVRYSNDDALSTLKFFAILFVDRFLLKSRATAVYSSLMGDHS